ncbi:erythromycin esterase family protein [Streptomyces sp. NPDC051907]|uniref:erythromycin esterase family protein n=1 Tax=Streptomyces sp. NPDC051907 TaxID=3155284 RepID=UPI0034341734
MTHDELVNAVVEQFLNEREQRPRLLALGEPLHGEEAFPLLRNALLRRLVDDEGCRCVALESGCLAGRVVDDYVHGGDGRLDQVMTDGVSHEFRGCPANRALVEWIGEHNRVRPPADRVRFAGFDAPIEHSGAESPRAALRVLHTFLAANCPPVPHEWSRIEALLGDDDRWTNPDVVMDPSQSIGDSADVRELRSITEDLGWLLASQAPQFTADGSAEALRDAELGARTAAGLLAYHVTLARTDPQERLARGLGIRDAMMAANLHALVTREREHDHGPVLAYGHNEHMRRGELRMQVGDMDLRWTPAGAHLARTHGPHYAVIATAIGSAPHLGIDEPTANTVEGLLAATTSAPRLVSAAELVKLVAGAADLTRRTSENRGYFPLDPHALDAVDAVLFLPHIDPPEPATEASAVR